MSDLRLGLSSGFCDDREKPHVASRGMCHDTCTSSGTWDILYGDLSIVSVDGTVTPVFFRQAGGSFANVWNTGQSDLNAYAEKPVDAGAAVSGLYNTTYFHGDPLGSARMMTAGEGWPVSAGVFYPFGQEAAPAADQNHFRYASLERDADSGLGPVTDHAAFRQYSPTTGSWMSPDPYDGSYDLGNPQSFNRYAYVLNNPLRYVDPLGLDTTTCFDYYDPQSGNTLSVCNVVADPDGGPGCTPIINPQGQFEGCVSQTPQHTGTYGPTQGSSGGSSGTPVAPNTVTQTNQPKSPARQQCEANAEQSYKTGMARANQDALRNWGRDIIGGAVGGFAGGCAAGAIPSGGVGCPVGALVGGLGGLVGGAMFGGMDGGLTAVWGRQRATEDYASAMQQCSQVP